MAQRLKHPNPSLFKPFRKFALVIVSLNLFLSSASSDPPPSTVPADFWTQEFEAGQLAAQKKNWMEAAGHFEKILEKSPLLPESFFNLAVSYRNSGSPLLAVLWFRAYWETLDPLSPERKTVAEEIRRLDAQIENKSQQLIRLVFEAAAKIPDEDWDERQRALETTALLQGLSGYADQAVRTVQQGVRPVSKDYFLRKYGEYLAAGGDEKGLAAVLAGIKDPAEADLLRGTLVRSQILRGRRDEVAKILPLISDAPLHGQLLTQLAAAYAQNAETGRVLALIPEVKNPQQLASLQTLFLLGELRAGNQKEAEDFARRVTVPEKGKSADPAGQVARIVLGEAPGVFDELMRSGRDQAEISKKIPLQYEAALAALWLGDLKHGQRGCETLRGEVKAKPSFSEYAVLACAYADAETGHLEKALQGLAALTPHSQTDFSMSLFRRLAKQKRWKDIQKLADALGVNPGARAAVLAESAEALVREKKYPEALSAAKQAADLGVQYHLGFILHRVSVWAGACRQNEFSRRLAAAEKTVHWSMLAERLKKKPSITDLGGYLGKNSTDDLKAVIAGLQQAAGDWISAALFIRCIEKRHQAR